MLVLLASPAPEIAALKRWSGDYEIGGDAAVGPTADGEFVWISDALRDGVVDDAMSS